MNEQIQQLLAGAPVWAREPAFLIGAGVVVALLLLWLLSRLFRSRPRDEEEIVAVQAEEYPPVIRPITPPPVAPPPPPIAEQPLAPPPPPLPPVTEVAPEPEAAPEPVFVAPQPQLIEPEPALPVAEEAPEPAPLADEPIAAAAPFEASPASIAADLTEPALAPAPVAEPQPTPAATAAPDDLTRMKGVGPRLADRLNSVGITSFAQLAALTPADADALDAQLGDFQGRIHRDRWIEQAGYLASGDLAGFEATFGKL